MHAYGTADINRFGGSQEPLPWKPQPKAHMQKSPLKRYGFRYVASLKSMMLADNRRCKLYNLNQT
jgi:hypothetical protein